MTIPITMAPLSTQNTHNSQLSDHFTSARPSPESHDQETSGCWCLLPQFQAFVRFYPEASSFLMILLNLSEIITVTPSSPPSEPSISRTLCKSDLSKTPKAIVIAASWSISAIKIEKITSVNIFWDGVSPARILVTQDHAMYICAIS